MKEDSIISNEPGKIYCGQPIMPPPPPKSTIIIGDGYPNWCIGVDKKFNWFQKKMLKWCFGFIIKENKDNG